MNLRSKVLFVCAIPGLAACADTVTPTQTNELEGNVLVHSTAEPPGENCTDGGTAVTLGVDTNNDGVLSEDEPPSTTYVCADSPATSEVTLTAVEQEAPGENCADGGVRIDSGVDANDDGSLGEDEVTGSQYVCFDAPNLIAQSEHIGDATEFCPGGFVATRFGFDADGDGALSEEEVTMTTTTCNLPPEFLNESTLSVEDCGTDIELPLQAHDPDGDTLTFTLVSGETYEGVPFTLSPEGVLGLPSGAHSARADVVVQVTDEYGITAEQHIRVLFRGSECRLDDTFYGIDPASCVELDVYPLTGDDRGEVVVTQRYVYVSGDDALIRMGRDLVGPEVLSGPVDTLVSDYTDLYSLWRSDFTDTDLIAAATSPKLTSEDSPEGYDQIVRVNEEDFTISAAITLEEPVVSEGLLSDYPVGEELLSASVNGTAMAITDGHLVTASLVSVETQTELLLQVYDLSDGARVSRLALSDRVDGLDPWGFSVPETKLFSVAAHTVDGEEWIMLRYSYSGWYELNARTGEVQLRTDTTASYCDIAGFAFDRAHGQIWGQAEWACFDETGTIAEEVFVCDALVESNAGGRIDDRGYD